MKLIADLHIHSKHSRATSKHLNLENLEKYAKIKGINLIGTGDFTHPKWFKELKENLIEDETGILKSKTGFKFVLQTEISLIYTQSGRGRRIHNILLAPDLDTVQQITDYLLTKGRVDYDGRPIFKIPCPDFVESLRSINKKIEVIPAHIWTPWFSLFGSKSGFDTITECFQDQTKHIHALETGLSSDPAMNWRLSQLDKYTLISNSDLHSYWPWRMGRECNVLDIKPTYDALLNCLKTKKGFKYTIEVDPSYGKYHEDGHRKCKVCMAPRESLKHRNICPVCKKELTIGVLHRVEELADRPEGFVPKSAIPFKHLIPLSDILSKIVGKAVNTKTINAEYDKIIPKFGNEMNVLLDVSYDDLAKVCGKKIARAIVDSRDGKIKVQAGFDGEYGVPIFSKKDIVKYKKFKPPKGVKPLILKKELQKGIFDY